MIDPYDTGYPDYTALTFDGPFMDNKTSGSSIIVSKSGTSALERKKQRDANRPKNPISLPNRRESHGR